MAYKLVTAEKVVEDTIYGVIACDAKADAVDNMIIGENAVGLGSIAYTKELDVAVYDSNGHWNWL